MAEIEKEECPHKWKYAQINERVLLWVCESCRESKTIPLSEDF